VFFEVAELDNPSAEPFAVIRVDTSKRVGTGVEGVVVSTHPSREDADHACENMRLAGRIGDNTNRADLTALLTDGASPTNGRRRFRIDAVSTLPAVLQENERFRAFASDVQWEVVMDALDKWTKHGGSDLVALGIIGQGLLILDDLRRSALAP
jgi:hypothetical protein